MLFGAATLDNYHRFQLPEGYHCHPCVDVGDVPIPQIKAKLISGNKIVLKFAVQ